MICCELSLSVWTFKGGLQLASVWMFGFFLVFGWQFELFGLLIVLQAAGNPGGRSGVGMTKPPSSTSRKLLM